MAMKLSIGLFLLRLSTVSIHRIIIWSTIVVTELTSCVYFLVFILQCQPASYFWTRYTGAEGICVNENIPVLVGYVYSAVSCACDWTLGILPIFVVWNLQMNSRTKVSVGIILAVGSMYVSLLLCPCSNPIRAPMTNFESQIALLLQPLFVSHICTL